MISGRQLLELQETIKKGERLTDDQVKAIAKLRRVENANLRHVKVQKIKLSEGEELMDFVWAMMDAVQTNRVILADGSLDARLEGIFEDHVIVRDGNTGRTFKANFSRAVDGSIVFEEPIEVRAVFVPVERLEGDGEVVERAIQKASSPMEFVTVSKDAGIATSWSSILPRSLRGGR